MPLPRLECPPRLAGRAHVQIRCMPPGSNCSLEPCFSTSWLMYAHVILEGIGESKTAITPGHIEGGTDEVVIRVVAEVRDDDRRNSVPVARSRGHGGVVLGGRNRRTRVYLECSLYVREGRVR